MASQYDDWCRQLANVLLETANQFANLIDEAPEDWNTAFLWNCMDDCRRMADELYPPQADFGGPNVIGLWAYRKEEVG